MDSGKKQLLDLISEASLAMVDIALFLDTHPYDQEALKCFGEYKKLYMDMEKEYSKKYGPLKREQADCEQRWLWALQPWPWKEC